MSDAGWGLVIVKLPVGVASPLDLEPLAPAEVLGPLPEVVAKIRDIEPDAEFSNPALGWIRSPTWSIELAIGREDPVEWIRLFVRGHGDEVVERIARLAALLGCMAFDDGALRVVSEDHGLDL